MLTTLQGVSRKGKIILANNPADVPDETPVIVTFLGGPGITCVHGVLVKNRQVHYARNSLLSQKNGIAQRWACMTTTKRTLKRGDVVLVLFPHSEL